MKFDIRILLIGMVISGLIFVLDTIFGLGIISLFYVLFLLSAFVWGKNKRYIISSLLSSIILVLTGWMLQTRETEYILNIGIINAGIEYEGLFRVFSIVILVVLGIVLIKQRVKEEELNEFSETLELRILARTASAENRARRLECQIQELQKLRSDNVSNSLKKLDCIISELRNINKLEQDNATSK